MFISNFKETLPDPLLQREGEKFICTKTKKIKGIFNNNKKTNKQRGQSLLYVTVLIVILISGVFFVYDIGNMVNTKIKFQNGADAAALASVAVKISKHHTDTMVRTSMYHESVAAQAEQRAAQALLVKIILDVNDAAKPPIPVVEPGAPGINPPPIPGPGAPSGPGGNIQQPGGIISEKTKQDADKYKELVNLTYRHVVKLHRERKALEAYYGWLSDDMLGAAPQAALEAARLGLRGNTFGLLTPRNAALAENLKILNDKKELLENRREFMRPIGGVVYPNEGANKVGNFGKTFLEFDGNGISTTQGASLLKYLSKYTLKTNAAARIASSDELKRPKTLIGINSIAKKGYPFEMLWYSPRLMPIELKTDVTIH